MKNCSLLFGLICALLVISFGCGGSSSKGTKTAEDGRIYLTNNSTEDIKVNYVNEESGLKETLVNRGETKEISQGNLKGGSTVIFHVDAYNPCAGGKIDIPITIAGNTTIRVKSAVCQSGVIEYELAGG